MASAGGKLQHQLQSAVQGLRWTYSLYWQLCLEQGILVWSDGYYNGDIKTRKTVQPVEVSAEEASLQRSQQLWELYESLSAGPETAAQPARRPCAALSPEDLTESEWFYLMCVSFSFPPGTGLPGKAYAEKRPVWMTRANEADSKYFPRAILAKSAGIKTVVCIPLANGVLELGCTEKVEEDTGLVRKARSFFTEQQEVFSMHSHRLPPKPTLSEHSTSDPVSGSLFHSPPLTMIHLPRIEPLESTKKIDDEDQDEDEDEDEDEEDEEECGDFGPHDGANGDEACDAVAAAINIDAVEVPTEPSGVMQMEMSSDVRLGSSRDDCSSNFSMDVPALAPLDLDANLVAGPASADKDPLQQTPGFHRHLWPSLLEAELSATPFQETTQEDAHYSQTVSTIMQHNNASQMSESCCVGHLNLSSQSAFAGWSRDWAGDGRQQPAAAVASQHQLKYILFNVPFLYDVRNDKVDGDGDEQRFQRVTSQDDLSASHVLAERRRREKLNERFVVLRSLVPFVTKMDKASILGDTIEYVKQLCRRIQELESRATPVSEVEQRPDSGLSSQAKSAQFISPERSRFMITADRRKARALEGGVPAWRVMDASSNCLQVSIIEADALLELQCPYREGVLLKIMQKLQELRMETTSVQSSSTIDDIFVAELRAKVKEDVHGKRANIIDVKKAIHQIFTS